LHDAIRTSSRHPPSIDRQISVRALRLASLALPVSAVVASSLDAQAIGVPIAPSAFVAPGLSLGANVGVASGRAGALAVVAFGGGEGRWQLSAGAGGLVAPEGYRSPALSYGGRVGLRLFDGARFGVVAFGGLGGASYRLEEIAGRTDESVRRTQVPVGVSLGMRRRWGAAGSSRAWGASLAPAYVWSTLRASDGATTRVTGARATALAEVALSRRLGLSVAYEDGRRARPEEPGARGGVLGVGIAIAR
jgi:hypothetical protein